MSKYQHTGRTEQTKAALKRLIDARKLQNQNRWRGAMYMAGYGIECKLKARLMEIYGLDRLEQLEEQVDRSKTKSYEKYFKEDNCAADSKIS